MESLRFEIEPFGINSTIVEPGFFRTDLLSKESTAYAELTIEDYADRTAETRPAWEAMSGKQTNDPAKLARAVVTIAAATPPPLRFVAGADAVEAVEQEANELLAQVDAYRCTPRAFTGADTAPTTSTAAREKPSACPKPTGRSLSSRSGKTTRSMPSLLTLFDVMATGHHAALAARVAPGKIAAGVGDGAVGLCGVIAAKRLGAEQIIIVGRHPDRTALATEFGAMDVVTERGEEAVERVRELTNGFGAHSVLECVGHDEATETALGLARAGGAVGRVGLPQHEEIPTTLKTFFDNVTISGGPAPARAYIEELLPDVLEGRIEPGRVFDRVTDLDGVPEGYRAMNDREAIKVMVKP